ncbi:CHAP domain-containing protein [Flavipsychrobacter stenotrophus]|uniref:CHAP domain-containing protein n=2 Tax=Flavipsychrobacter stenotrophus TaxID=2077091 RepID=A0A2S7SRM5_9BACT|nr:CHAP domain-containing protein [Flavipsychrobacter stenotrophus]
MMAVLELARKEIGVQEVPKNSNKGPRVEEYLRSVGLGGGYAWCAALVYWLYLQAAKQLGVSSPVVKTGGVLVCYNKTNPLQIVTVAQAIAQPELLVPGMQFIMRFANGTGHTGLIEAVAITKAGIMLKTIEGNTNDDGSREGYMVARRNRMVNSAGMFAFIKY